MATNNRRERRSQAQWQGLIERAADSTLSIAAFCCAEGVSTGSFYSWRRRLGAVAPGSAVAQATGEDGAFLELGVLGDEAGGPASWDIELALGAGMLLRLRRR